MSTKSLTRNNYRSLLYMFSIAAILVLLAQSCGKEEVLDPNLDKYTVEKITVLTTKKEDLNAIYNITKATGNDYNIDAIVPDDGNPGKFFFIDLKFPDGITPISVTPVTKDSINFSIPKSFTVKFTETQTKIFTITIAEQAPEAPSITAFTITGSEAVAIDNDNLRVSVRMPAGANVSAIVPKFTLKPATAQVVGGSDPINFSEPKSITIKNGAISRSYTINVSDYGFTKVTTLMDRSLATNARPIAFAADSETSLAFDATGRFIFIANAKGIKKYDVNAPTAAPTELNITHADGSPAPTTVLQRVGNNLIAGNAMWEAGAVRVSAWPATGTSDAPVEILNITLPGKPIIQNFQIKDNGTSILVYFVDRAPLRSSPTRDPILYTAEIPLSNIASKTKVTTLKSTENFSGLIASGMGDGPLIELTAIPNSNEFILNSGTMTPTIVSSTLGTPVRFSSAIVNASSVGVKAIEHNRGKYLMYGVFSWNTNLLNPRNSRFVVLDMTKKGYRQTMLDVSSELTTNKFTTWNSIQKIDAPLGGEKGDTANGGFYCQTASAVTASGKLRLAGLVAANGFTVVEVD
jgi:hypothetical protein